MRVVLYKYETGFVLTFWKLTPYFTFYFECNARNSFRFRKPKKVLETLKSFFWWTNKIQASSTWSTLWVQRAFGKLGTQFCTVTQNLHYHFWGPSTIFWMVYFDYFNAKRLLLIVWICSIVIRFGIVMTVLI